MYKVQTDHYEKQCIYTCAHRSTNTGTYAQLYKPRCTCIHTLIHRLSYIYFVHKLIFTYEAHSSWYRHPHTHITQNMYIQVYVSTHTPQDMLILLPIDYIQAHSHTCSNMLMHIPQLHAILPGHVPAARCPWVPAGLEAGAGTGIVVPLTDGVGRPQRLGI